MSWKVMSPAEVCDLMDFWAAVPWPLSEAEAQHLAVKRFGWTIEVEDGSSYLMNTVSNFTFPDVATVDSRRRLMYLSLEVSDSVDEVTPESTAFLRDAFTAMVREGEARWGAPAVSDRRGTIFARWEVAGRARISFSSSPKGLSGKFETPQGAEVERRLGD